MSFLMMFLYFNFLILLSAPYPALYLVCWTPTCLLRIGWLYFLLKVMITVSHPLGPPDSALPAVHVKLAALWCQLCFLGAFSKVTAQAQICGDVNPLGATLKQWEHHR